jgi:pimeloyl-ACP methyl ester carboxylesterase
MSIGLQSRLRPGAKGGQLSISSQLGEQKQVSLPQGTIAYRERGTGEPIVFVHGLLVNGDLWRKVVPPLSKDFRCITPDWPLGSHELPMNADTDLTPPGIAKLIDDFLAALGLENVTLVGNDSGGAISQIVVTEHPGRVARLVLTPCDAFEVFPPRMFRYLGLVARIPGGMFELAQSMRIRPLRRLPIAFGWLTKKPLEREISDSYVQPSMSNGKTRRDTAKFVKAASSEYTLAAARKAVGFERPVLVAWAGEDRFFKPELGRRLAAAFPNARLEVIDNSRTFVPEDQPERLVELIAAFAREPVAAAA